MVELYHFWGSIACIAILTFIMLIQVFMMFLGLGHSSGDSDVNVDLDGDGNPDGIYGMTLTPIPATSTDAATDSRFRLLSIGNIIFLAIFG